jgi:hypothetical protein
MANGKPPMELHQHITIDKTVPSLEMAMFKFALQISELMISHQLSTTLTMVESVVPSC